MSLCHQHDFVGGKGRGKGDVRQGRHAGDNVLVAFETSWGLWQNPNMRVDPKNFVFQTGLKATHHREDHDQDHHADRHPTHRDQR